MSDVESVTPVGQFSLDAHFVQLECAVARNQLTGIASSDTESSIWIPENGFGRVSLFSMHPENRKASG